MADYPKKPRKWLGVLVILLLIPTAIVLFLFPIPRFTRMDSEVGNLFHAPCFAVLAVVLSMSCLQILPRRPVIVAIGVWMALALFGFGSEALQSFVRRSPSWHDAAANVLGAAAGVLWLQSRMVRKTAVSRGLLAAAIMLLLLASIRPSLALYEFYEQHRAMPSVASFERHHELQHWRADRSAIVLSRRCASDGDFSLRVDMFPASWSSANLIPAPDWSPYEEFVFDVWVADPTGNVSHDHAIDLGVRIVDRSNTWEVDERFQVEFPLPAGRKQTARVQLSDVRTAPKFREMELDNIQLVQFFVLQPKKRYTIWLDNLRLE